MSVTFVLGETTVALPDPAPGYPVRSERRQAVGRTAGGQVYVYDKGVTTTEAILPFESLTDAEKTALAAFFADEAEAAANTFTYTDSHAAAHTARFLDSRLDFVKVAGGVWDVRVRLELEPVGS